VAVWAKKIGHGPNEQLSAGSAESPHACIDNPAKPAAAQTIRKEMEPKNRIREAERAAQLGM
jgi:hypothetical protein